MATSAEPTTISTNSTIPCGTTSLFCRSVVPTGRAWASLGVIHGYGDHCGRHEHVLQWMARHGVACHTMDFRGHGRSPGRRGFVSTWEDFLIDLRAFLAKPELAEPTAPPLFLLGHSHGGLVLAAAALTGLPNVRGVILTSPYFRNLVPVPWHKLVLARIANVLFPALKVHSGMRREWLSSDADMRSDREQDTFALNFATPRWFITMRGAQRNILARASEFRMPMLMLLGSADPVADPIVAQNFFAQAPSADKTLKVYPGLLHEILRETSRESVFEDILGWMKGRTAISA